MVATPLLSQFKVLFNNQYNYYAPVITIDCALNNIDFILKAFLCLLFFLKIALGWIKQRHNKCISSNTQMLNYKEDGRSMDGLGR